MTKASKNLKVQNSKRVTKLRKKNLIFFFVSGVLSRDPSGRLEKISVARKKIKLRNWQKISEKLKTIKKVNKFLLETRF